MKRHPLSRFRIVSKAFIIPLQRLRLFSTKEGTKNLPRIETSFSQSDRTDSSDEWSPSSECRSGTPTSTISGTINSPDTYTHHDVPPVGVATYKQDPLHVLRPCVAGSQNLEKLLTQSLRGTCRKLRRFALDLCLSLNVVPGELFVGEVECMSEDNYACGGYADVYCGMLKGEKVALKRLRTFQMADESACDRMKKAFFREALLWQPLHHPNILPFIGITESVFNFTTCMVLPWMEDGNIRDYLGRERDAGRLVGQKFLDVVNRWLYQIADGIMYLHARGIVHGDLRGANILIDGKKNARLADFGLAADEEWGCSIGPSNSGSLGWLAPELLDPDATSFKPTRASDVYSFGCVCVELYSCESPFAGLNQGKIIRKLMTGEKPNRPSNPGEEMSDDFWGLVQKCWNTNPHDRPTSEQLVAALKIISPCVSV